jgi:hypothetical protein
MKLLPGAVFALSLFLCASCSSTAEQHRELQIVTGRDAYDIRSEQLGSPAVMQLTYKVNLKYPQKAVSEREVQRLQAAGWTQCQQATDSDWTYFRDLTTNPNRYVHQYETRLSNGKRLLAVTMMYFSSPERDLAANAGPDNVVQHVIAITYDLGNDNVRRQIGDLISTCKQ